MKKTIRKPENWQDFESLCKMLWGEIWAIPDKIKKNGRLGQSQFGVDVYGVPKGKINYSGIQCKGKDDYSNATIFEKEIDEEIEKAKKFTPALETFIFATTANKNSKIEAYIRKKDLESRTAGEFEILIFCWEDIADLIESNRDTFNYYISGNQFKSKHELIVSFSDGSDRFVVKPQFKKRITKHKTNNPDLSRKELSAITLLNHSYLGKNFGLPLSGGLQNINNSWTKFGITFSNTGSTAFDDYKLFLYPEVGKFRKISGYSGGVADKLFYLQHSPIYIREDDNYSVVYRSKDNLPLIQKDERSFDLSILTLHEKYELKIAYEFLARDYNQEGELILVIDPEYRIEENIVFGNSSEEVLEDEVEIDDIKSSGPLF